uniref:Uncharacterized protein n=1 Tax=Arundo donax TaxID=35708 RepID=A0A0A9HUG3_ARUDO
MPELARTTSSSTARSAS